MHLRYEVPSKDVFSHPFMLHCFIIQLKILDNFRIQKKFVFCTKCYACHQVMVVNHVVQIFFQAHSCDSWQASVPLQLLAETSVPHHVSLSVGCLHSIVSLRVIRGKKITPKLELLIYL